MSRWRRLCEQQIFVTPISDHNYTNFCSENNRKNVGSPPRNRFAAVLLTRPLIAVNVRTKPLRVRAPSSHRSFLSCTKLWMEGKSCKNIKEAHAKHACKAFRTRPYRHDADSSRSTLRTQSGRAGIVPYPAGSVAREARQCSNNTVVASSRCNLRLAHWCRSHNLNLRL
ncbi:hypothetical protein PHSY_002718 [Pseudozyma hubeiensis SY62]|uniref:Uncharacterized protein n=1 Tax=Pseudozyma hubeiensis (strain SY62) TaxID=1305764 RepID=R9P1H2_PSEHS|nr:hypothetical protein PHSY_002718 [Pseudozyma hubeiensis SY62]GAC95143.1 hypothetical protein PHSY_002718 [Pseudozyma hubeiensis SY62]